MDNNRKYFLLKWLPTFGLSVVTAMTDSMTGMNWDWYCALNQPPWDPKGNYPTHFFFLIGACLNVGIGISSYAVYREGGGLEEAQLPLVLYGTQLALQWAYIPLLMGFKSIRLALVDVSLATGLTGAATVLFRKIHDRTFPLMIPYLLFLGMANFHTLTLYAFNLEYKSVRSHTQPEDT